MAVIVISVGASAQLEMAVRSLLAQPEKTEIVVVNSGGGDAASLLHEVSAEISIIENAALLWPGAARNHGIAASSAPFVAFLAEDCLAAPGWIAARLVKHRNGISAVGSALLNDKPGNPVACAAHLTNFVRRLPNTPADAALAYGASYDRSLFVRYGVFREDMRTGEDTEFHRRIPASERPVWTPTVMTIHRNPERIVELMREQHGRGRRMVATQRQLGAPSRSRMLSSALGGIGLAMINGFAWSDRKDRRRVVLAWPLMLLAAAAYILGILAAEPKRSDPGQ